MDLRGRVLRGQRGQSIRLSVPTSPEHDASYTCGCAGGTTRVWTRQDGWPQQTGSQRPRTWAEKEQRKGPLDEGGVAITCGMLGGDSLRALAANRIEAATPLHARRSVGRIPNRKSRSGEESPGRGLIATTASITTSTDAQPSRHRAWFNRRQRRRRCHPCAPVVP